jgi:hypothetical protein
MTDRFEDRLLRELHEELPPHPVRPKSPPRHRLLIGVGGLATLAVTAVAAAVAVAAAPAYAVHTRPDGSFAVVLDSTADDNLAAAERDLRARGARIELVAETLTCLNPLAPPDSSLPAEPHGPLGTPPWFAAFQAADDRRNPITGERLESHEWAFTVRPAAIPPGEVLWVAVNGPGIPGSGLVTAAGFAAEGAGPPRLC